MGGTPTQVTLAWLMAQPSVTAPIASATSLEQLEDLLRATELRLPATALEKLDQVSRPTVSAYKRSHKPASSGDAPDETRPKAGLKMVAETTQLFMTPLLAGCLSH